MYGYLFAFSFQGLFTKFSDDVSPNALKGSDIKLPFLLLLQNKKRLLSSPL